MIEDEQKLSKRYMLKTKGRGDKTFPLLTIDNVAKVEAMILNDAAYLKSSDEYKGPAKGYSGSTAFWMSRLSEDIRSLRPLDRDTVFSAVCAVDRENSTHLNADKCGRKELTDRLLKISPTSLEEILRNPSPDYELIRILSEKTNGGKGRENFSFATKFCHYAAFYLFDGQPEMDNFSIYDNVVKNALPKYIDIYAKELSWDGLCNKKRWILQQRHSYEEGANFGERYKNYLTIIDKLRNISNPSISRNGFDHLLWYYFKGR